MNGKLTKARLRALEAVADGKVKRVYRGGGNVLLGPKGVSSTTLWHLYRAGLIRDGEMTRGAVEVRCPQVLTPAGRAALEATK
mgnify:FL=1